MWLPIQILVFYFYTNAAAPVSLEANLSLFFRWHYLHHIGGWTKQKIFHYYSIFREH